MDQPTQSGAATYPARALPVLPIASFRWNERETRSRGNRCGNHLGDTLMRPEAVVVLLVDAEDSPQMRLSQFMDSRGSRAAHSAKLSGTGVTIYFACSSYPTPCTTGELGAGLSLTGNVTLDLSAPTLGGLERYCNMVGPNGQLLFSCGK